MTVAARIDPLPDQAQRCKHEMLRGQCSWCKGLPDVPVDFGLAEPDREPHARPSSMRYPAERRGNCAHCDEDYKTGAYVAWSATDGGVIGPCCTEAAL